MSANMVLDPTGAGSIGAGTQLAARLPTLQGARVALIDNTKPNADLLLAAVGQRLQRAGVVAVHTFVKDLVGVPVDAATIDEIRETCDFAIAAIGDCGSCSAGTAQDSLVLEQNGIPAVSICTEPFALTVRTVATSYGAPNFEFIFTSHPIASLNADELEVRADSIASTVTHLVVAPS